VPEHVFPLIEVSGTSYEMGYQHGAQVGDRVRGYLVWIERLTGVSRDVLCRNALQYLPFIESLSPLLVDEIRGLAEGAALSFEEALLCQLRADAARVHNDGGCTAFALTRSATADGMPLAGQNVDLQPEYADVAIVVRIKPADGRPRALMFTFAGQLGYSGLNEHGVAHFTNELCDSPWRLALSHYPVKRVMLEQRTVEDCVNVLRRHRICMPTNQVICDGTGDITDVEVRPEAIAIFEDEHPDIRLHTNHYLTPEFRSYGTDYPDSLPRLARFRTMIRAQWGGLNVDTLKLILADHEGDPAGICRHGASGLRSVFGYIAEPARRLLHVRRGHACTGTWESVEV
jgi:isopenicillin-N N-acyltransferase like protein